MDDVKATVKKIQKVIYGILCDIDDFCRENRIRYYLSGGTCLGAVRHHGFIPWDDDADLMMPRGDYERLIDLFPKKGTGKYFLESLSTDPTWPLQHAKICDRSSWITFTKTLEKPIGIHVDIFPIDGLPGGRLSQKLFYKKMQTFGGFRSASLRREFAYTSRALLARAFGARYFAEKMDEAAKQYDFESSRYVAASVAAHYGERETMEKQGMDKGVDLPFEGRMFPVPIGYERYLTNLYGDYMTIPKDAERKGYTHFDQEGWVIRFGAHEKNLEGSDE